MSLPVPVGNHSPTFPYVGMRRVIHPGLARWSRVLTATTPTPRTIVATLPEGANLYAAIVALFADRDLTVGALRLLGGTLSPAVYHVATPDGVSPRAVEYGDGIVIDGGARIISASGSFGPDLSGAPLIHLHAALSDRDGRTHGGHIGVDACSVGPGGLRIVATAGVGFVQRHDPETAYSTFFPQAEGAA